MTLIELLVIVAIVGILIVGAGLGIRAFLEASRLREAVTTVQVRTADARRLAKQTDQVVDLSIKEDDGAWVVAVAGNAYPLTGITVRSGPTNLSLNPPYGTFNGADEEIVLGVGNREAVVTITGILARTVVAR